MEAHNGGMFPSYNGPALCRAMHSSRGRTKSSLLDSKCSEGASCFDLLAAVAGQILQDSGNDAKHFPCKTSDRDIPKNLAHICLKESMPECKQGSTFIGDQAEITDSMSLEVQSSDHQSPPFSKANVKEEIEVHNYHLQGSIKYNSVYYRSLTVKISENQALSPMMDCGEYLLGETVHEGCSTKWDGGKNCIHPVAVEEEDGFTVKSDNESGTASVDCKDKSAGQRQTGGRGNLSLPSGMQEPCRMNQTAHEYSLKDAGQPESRILNEDVLSNETMMEQDEDFEEECSKLKRLEYEYKNAVELIRKGHTIETTELKKSFSKLQHSKPGEGVCTLYTNSMHADRDKESALLGHYESMSNCPKSSIRMTDLQADSLAVTGSLVLKEQTQTILDNGNKSPGLLSIEQEKTAHLNREVSNCFMSKPKAKKPSRLRCENSYELINCRGGSNSSCLKRKPVEVELPQVTGEIFVRQFLYGENARRRQRSSRVSKFRRKRASEKESIVSTFSLPQNNIRSSNYHLVDGELRGSAAKIRRAKAVRVASSQIGREDFPVTQSGEPHVKFSIKSFTVPELLLDLPGSATVANLKKAVMDAAMGVLGGDLRVRVLLQGQKVPDEGATLAQLGISQAGKPESLGFMLEPTATSTVSSDSDDPLLLLSHAASQPSPRYATFHQHGVRNEETLCPATKLFDPKSGSDVAISATMPFGKGINIGVTKLIGKESGGTDELSKGQICWDLQLAAHQRAPLGLNERDTSIGAMIALREQIDLPLWPKHESESTSTLSEVTPLSAHDAGAIMLHPRDNDQVMAIVSMQQNNLLQAGTRRIRRPFSVVEVEALVTAVEKLGTGRWRDIKVMAFDQAKHRTYVDLKDKWKTLVHTAQIPPHHRRGEPVPQELLERVVQANSYWASQQVKQQAETGV